MKVAVDFDRTLIGWFEFPFGDYKMLDNAEKVIKNLSKKGVEFELYTARYGWLKWKAIWFIKKNKLPIKTKLSNRKPKADLYIDDHNIFCKKIDWLEIEKEITRLIKEKK